MWWTITLSAKYNSWTVVTCLLLGIYQCWAVAWGSFEGHVPNRLGAVQVCLSIISTNSHCHRLWIGYYRNTQKHQKLNIGRLLFVCIYKMSQSPMLFWPHRSKVCHCWWRPILHARISHAYVQWQWSSNAWSQDQSKSIIQNFLGVDCPNISLVAFLLCTEFLRNAVCLNSHGLKTLAYKFLEKLKNDWYDS